ELVGDRLGHVVLVYGLDDVEVDLRAIDARHRDVDPVGLPVVLHLAVEGRADGCLQVAGTRDRIRFVPCLLVHFGADLVGDVRAGDAFLRVGADGKGAARYRHTRRGNGYENTPCDQPPHAIP